MKRKKRHFAPQFEFGFAPATFNLFSESTSDGDRLAREQAEEERARREAQAAQDAAQCILFPTRRHP
jgi:hypothetical protein